MFYDNKDFLRKRSIELYLEGKTMIEISEILKCSRNYVSELIKNDPDIIQYRNKSKVKVLKQKKQKRMNISISTNFFKKIGISEDVNIDEYVDITVDNELKEITIKKHKG